MRQFGNTRTLTRKKNHRASVNILSSRLSFTRTRFLAHRIEVSHSRRPRTFPRFEAAATAHLFAHRVEALEGPSSTVPTFDVKEKSPSRGEFSFAVILAHTDPLR